MNTPKEMKYTKNHEWIKIENGIATEGLTDYAQSELSDIAFVELPETGTKVKQEEACGTIEAVKAVSELFAAVSGEIVEVNETIKTDASLINSDPYGEGWLIKIKAENINEADSLMDWETYIKYCEEHGH